MENRLTQVSQITEALLQVQIRQNGSGVANKMIAAEEKHNPTCRVFVIFRIEI